MSDDDPTCQVDPVLLDLPHSGDVRAYPAEDLRGDHLVCDGHAASTSAWGQVRAAYLSGQSR